MEVISELNTKWTLPINPYHWNLCRMSLPIVNPFAHPYRIWSKREPSFEEMTAHMQNFGRMMPSVNDELLKEIDSPIKAGMYMAECGANSGLGHHVESFLDHDTNYKCWRSAMPSKTPIAIADYQQKYPRYNAVAVTGEISTHGHILSDGQFLFHGGLWPGGSSSQFVTNRPFSTSLCPQVALRNAEFGGKAYDAGAIHLFVLRATDPTTKTFVFRRSGTKHGHENEVLFAAGAKLNLLNITLIRQHCKVTKHEHVDMTVPVYILEVSIS